MSNIKIGSDCEKEVSSILRKHKYWVYRCPVKTGGQPMDIIAAKTNKITYFWLIDAKHVREENPSFTLSRIEPNQWATMDFARNFAGLQNLGFAIKFDRTGKIYWLSYDNALKLKNEDIKSINLSMLEEFEKELEKDD